MATNRTGTALADQLNGNSGQDSMSGLAGDDTLRGNGGNDTLNGGSGLDYLVGGSGNDIYVVDSFFDRVVESAGGGTDTVRTSVSYLLPEHVERLVLTGNSDIDGAGNSLANLITGNGKDNTISGNGGADSITGGGGDDELYGNTGADSLRGDAGDDDLSGGAGADRIFGGAGDDQISGGAGRDTLLGGGGTDAMWGGAGVDVVSYADSADGVTAILAGFGTEGDALGDTYHGIENMIGSSHDDFLQGDDLANQLIGGAGADDLDGEGGSDTIYGDAADNSFVGGDGFDWLVLEGGGDIYEFAGDSPVFGIENIDLSSPGGNMLILDEEAVLQASTVLFLHGTTDARLATTDLWNLHPVFEEGFRTFGSQSDEAILLVDEAIDTSDVRVSMTLAALDGVFGGIQVNGDPDFGAGASSSSVGDVNGDGYDDFIVTVPMADDVTGAAYVVFGSSSGASMLDLSELDGTNGFRLSGEPGESAFGFDVAAAGDVNGDGFGDIIASAPYAANGPSESGSVYVVFGTDAGFSAVMQMADLDGTTGFRIDGSAVSEAIGLAIAGAGDVNGDGFSDVLIGTSRPGDYAGTAYLVFGQETPFASAMSVTSLSGTNGFKLVDDGDAGFFGFSVAGAGDLNGDGYGDIAISAPGTDANGINSGASYVVFGASAFTSVFSTTSLSGSNGFALAGSEYDRSGDSIASAGDVNGDGWADIIVSSTRADPDGRFDAGAAYVVFGHGGAFSDLDLSALDGTNGFRLEGIDNYDQAGSSVASAGDFNGDGIDDLLIGAWRADEYEGETYLVFGRATGFGSSLVLSSLDGEEGLRINGESAYDRSGDSVASAGDVNGDGFSDLIIGAIFGDAPYASNSGANYVVYGGDFSGAVTHQGTAENDTAVGTAGADVFVGGEGSDTFAGQGGADVFRGGAGDDRVSVTTAGFADLDGGGGLDTLAVAGPLDLDLTAIGNTRISGFEIIELGTGTNSLTASLRDLLNLSDTSSEVTIDGGAGDAVEITDGVWDFSEVAVGGYYAATSVGLTLRINAAIALEDISIPV